MKPNTAAHLSYLMKQMQMQDTEASKGASKKKKQI